MKMISRRPKGRQKKSPQGKIHIEVCQTQSVLAVSEYQVSRLLGHVFREVGFKNNSPIYLSVALVGDNVIRRLNRRYHDMDRVTDVLAFPLSDDDDAPEGLWGEIVVSVERAEINAKRFRNTLEREVAIYLIHGLLHLLGYRDHREKEFQEMALVQDHMMKKYFKGLSNGL